MDRVSPTNDLAFRKVLASEDNKDILQELITDFYEMEVKNLAIETPYSIVGMMMLCIFLSFMI